MEHDRDPACHARLQDWEVKMVRLIVAVLVTMGISLASPAIDPAVAKRPSCGQGLHINKKGKCVPDRHQKACTPKRQQNGRC
jgi:hypothetical protein